VSGAVVAAGIFLLVALLGFAAYTFWPQPPAASPPPDAAAPTNPSPPGADGALERGLQTARRNLSARDFRGAVDAAGAVLAADPSNAEARRIRDEASATLARFDGAVERSRGRIRARDAAGGARALEEARAIDPTAPAVVDLGLQLNDLIRQAETDARAAASRQRAFPPGATEPRDARSPDPGPERPGEKPPPPKPQAPPPRTDQQLAPPPPVTGVPPATPGTLPPALPATPEVTPKTSPPPASKPSPPSPPPTPDRSPSADDDAAAIRRLVASYARAIESKDIDLFRRIKPNLSREEERRLSDGFRAVTSQQVTLKVAAIEPRGDTAVVRVARHDTILADGRQRTIDSQQTLTVGRGGSGWVILDIR
jgi:hypothetical protein